MPNEKNDKYEEIENSDLQTPGVREEDDDDDDMDLDDGMDIEEPETVGSRHEPFDEESGKGDASVERRPEDDDKIPQDSDPAE